jgi:hypothetical protein
MSNLLKKTMLVLVFIITGAVLTINSTEAALDNRGTDFILGFLPNYSGTGNVELHITGDVATEVTVNYPVNSPTFTTTVTVVPGDVKIVSIPYAAQKNWVRGSIQNNCVHVFSEEEFLCYMVNRQPYTSDASLALPVDTFNTEYFTIDGVASNYGSEFVVVAAYDNTTIEAKLPNSTILNATLNRGEGFFFEAQTVTDLSGTLVVASNPVGVTSGNRCSSYDGSACDHIFEMLPPVAAWEKVIPAVNAPETSLGVRYKILASADDTLVYANGAAIASLDRGQAFLTGRLNNNYIFEANEPIMVAQLLANRQTSGGYPIGDPAIGILTPDKQYDSSYTFSTVGGSQFVENNVTIIAHFDDVGSLQLDGMPIPVGDYTQIGSSDYYATIQYLSDGAHATSSTGKHGITVEGFNAYDSYLYTGGALFDFVNSQGDSNPPINSCDGQYNCIASDNRPTEDANANGILDLGEDLNGNGIIDKDKGIFFIELASEAQNLALTVEDFIPGAGIVEYSVKLIDLGTDGSGTVLLKDGAGNITEVPVSFAVGSYDVCGDLDNDGDVDGFDLAIFRGALRHCTGDAGYINEADYNQDGCIDLIDYQMWYQCYKAYASQL